MTKVVPKKPIDYDEDGVREAVEYREEPPNEVE